MNRRHAKGQVGILTPVLVRNYLIASLAAVSMSVNQAGYYCFALCIDHQGILRDLYGTDFPDLLNTVVFYQDYPIFDNFPNVPGVPHRDNPAANQGLITTWFIGLL